MNERSVRTAWVSHAIVTRTGLLKYVAKRFLQITAMAVLGLWLGGPMSYAQSNAEGYIYGTAPNATSVVIESGTGLTRTVVVKSDGTYLIPALPTGNYKVTAKKGDAAVDVRDDVIVGVGVGTAVRFDGQALQLDKFIVSNSTMPPIDTSRTGASLSIRKETVDELPVIRNLSSVMLLAPQVSKGDAVFGDVPSFAGASVAENNYFVNGFNITDFRTGINFSRVPFDFQQSYQVLVGGYDAEYGRSLGGVTNTTTKSGSNNVVAGVSVYFEPDETNLHSKDVFQSDGLIYKANSLSYNQSLNTEVYAGFPLIKNHVFFYGLYEARDIKSNYASTNATSFYKDSTKNPFWGYKADYRINDDHRLEFTSFSDSRSTHEKTYDYDWDSHTLGAQTSTSQTLRGGLSNIIRYGGNFSEHFQMSLMYGKGSYNQTNSGSGDTLPLIIDSRSGALVYLNGANRDLIETGDDHRKAYRADGVLTFGTNSLKFGADREDNLSNDISSYSGGVYWRYYKAPASGVTNGAANNSQYTRKRTYLVGGSFKVNDDALYLQDDLKLMHDRLLLSAGLRSEGFKNYNKNDKVFVQQKNLIAPRLAVSFDPIGNGKSKIFANWGKYYIPIASNTNIRGSGGEYYNEQYYVLNSVAADGTPTIGSQLGPDQLSSDGIAPDPTTVAAIGLKPMFQIEYIVGGQIEIAKNWTLTVRGMQRSLNGAIDDTDVTPAIDRWAIRTGKPAFDPSAKYVLFNPGSDLTFNADVAGDGKLVPVTLTADDLQMPAPIRKYYAVAFILEHSFANKWYMSASYTWSHSYGNFEGWVKSDNEQADPGISSAFDYKSFTENTYGDLPNDRRHVFKLYGFYKVADEWTVGANALLQSGRPIAKTGQAPDQIGVSGYQGAYMLAQRGSLGSMPWLSQLDLSLTYKPKFFKKKATFALDVFNIVNSHTAIKNNEQYEDQNQIPLLYYGTVENYQSPRYIRLSVSYTY